jgi:DNA-binding winged helix-turn-helix (wHTH) protein
MATSQLQPPIVRFGVFEADLQAGELRRKGVKVRLQDLPFRALALLLSRPGVVITREEFRQALWPADVFVDFEQGISSAIMRLRDALKDSAENPVFIETIERRGYRWIAPIQMPAPVADDEVAKDAVRFELPLPKNLVPAETPAEFEKEVPSDTENRDFTARYEIGLTHTPKRGSHMLL